MHAISSYCGNRPTNTQTYKFTHRQDRLQYTAPQVARSVIKDLDLKLVDLELSWTWLLLELIQVLTLMLLF